MKRKKKRVRCFERNVHYYNCMVARTYKYTVLFYCVHPDKILNTPKVPELIYFILFFCGGKELLVRILWYIFCLLFQEWQKKRRKEEYAIKKDAENRKSVLHKKIDKWRSKIIAEDEAKRRVFWLIFHEQYDCLSEFACCNYTRKLFNLEAELSTFVLSVVTVHTVSLTYKFNLSCPAWWRSADVLISMLYSVDEAFQGVEGTVLPEH